MTRVPRIYNSKGEEIDTLPFIFGVVRREDSKYLYDLTIRPLDPSVLMLVDYYDGRNNYVETYKRENYDATFQYDDEKDEIVLYVMEGIDVAIFNMCSLLGIGKLSLDDAVPYYVDGFAPIHDKVSMITFTLEEFKQLDGMVALLKIKPQYIMFKGLLLGSRYIRDDVEDGDNIPNFKSDKLKRGEKLFVWD